MTNRGFEVKLVLWENHVIADLKHGVGSLWPDPRDLFTMSKGLGYSVDSNIYDRLSWF